jgi:hypothetical protein
MNDAHFEKLRCLTNIAGPLYIALANDFDLDDPDTRKAVIAACAKTAADIVEACAEEAFGRASADEKEEMQ